MNKYLQELIKLKSLIRRNDSCYFYLWESTLCERGEKGAWLSWLERRVHIAEIAGSIPAAPSHKLLHYSLPCYRET